MPPVHPAIVHYPIALITFSVLARLFGFVFGSQSYNTLFGKVACAAGLLRYVCFVAERR